MLMEWLTISLLSPEAHLYRPSSLMETCSKLKYEIRFSLSYSCVIFMFSISGMASQFFNVLDNLYHLTLNDSPQCLTGHSTVRLCPVETRFVSPLRTSAVTSHEETVISKEEFDFNNTISKLFYHTYL